jgi:hypothetical protein
MKKILAIVLIFLVGAIYWGLRPRVPLEESVPKERFSSSNETGLTDSNQRASLPANGAVSHSVEEDSQITLAIERLRKTLHGGTDEQIEVALEALAQLLQNDPGVHEVWASFAAESDPNMLAQLARILTPRVAANAELFQKVVDLAQRGDLAEKRSAALSMLSSISDPGPKLLDLVFRLSREDGAKDVRLSAIQLIGNWASHSQDWDDLSRELVKTINASNESEVRRFAIQVIALHPETAPPEVLGALADYMKQDPSAHNRAIAALGLGSVKGDFRDSALGHLEQAFAGEENINTRRNIITQIARAGEQDAIAILNRLPADHDALLAQDVRDYVEILQAGGVGPSDIYFAKFERDKERGTIVGSYDHAD